MSLKKGTVVLEEYNPAWKEMYKAEEKILRELLGNKVVEIKHVGSTSIEGLSAKPVIDIMVIIIHCRALIITKHQTSQYLHCIGMARTQVFHIICRAHYLTSIKTVILPHEFKQ